MKYRLKDKDAQAALKKNAPALYKAFQLACEDQFEDTTGIVGFSICDFYVTIGKDYIEAYDDHGPNKWNHYPEMTPPEGVPLQFQVVCDAYGQCHPTYRRCAIFKDGKWYEENGRDELKFDPVGDDIWFMRWGE